jgi:hypothetical protein
MRNTIAQFTKFISPLFSPLKDEGPASTPAKRSRIEPDAFEPDLLLREQIAQNIILGRPQSAEQYEHLMVCLRFVLLFY